MKKRIIALVLVGAFILSGCALAERFEEAKDAYLEERVAELMEDDLAGGPVAEEESPVVDLAPEETVEPVVVETVTAEPEITDEADDATGSKEAESTDEADDASADDEMEDDSADTDDDNEETEADVTPEVESDDPGVYLGDPDWVDEMEPGEYYWNLETDEYMSATYDKGSLRLQALSEVNGWRIASTPVLGDAYIEAVVKMGACKNTDGYGLIFRVPEKVNYNQGYFFGVTCDGKYSLRVWDGLSGESGKSTWLKYPAPSEYVLKGKDATNTLGVMAVADKISLYINGELVNEFIDDTYPEGFFGLVINRDYTENLTIHVDRVSYWTDPLK